MKAKAVKAIFSSFLICSFLSGCSASDVQHEAEAEVEEESALAGNNEAAAEDDPQSEELDEEYYEDMVWVTFDDASVNPKAQEVFEEIKKLNHDRQNIVTTDKGYITFLNGITTEKLCTNSDDYKEVMEAVLPALTHREGLQFKQTETLIDDYGNVIVKFKEVFGSEISDINTIKLFFDPNGKMLGLSSTILPFAESSGKEIDENKAVEVVKDYLAKTDPDVDYKFITGDVERKFTHQVDQYTGIEYLKEIYVVKTNNPEQESSISESPYLDHQVTLQGTYIDCFPAYVKSELDENRNFDVFDKWFANADVRSYSTTVTLDNGIERKIEVPVVYHNGVYYLEDPTRQMLCADYYDFKFNNEINIIRSTTNDDWEVDDILAYYNYLICYDYYNEVGWQGPDGVGGKTLLLMDYVDENKKPVNNLCYLGKIENVDLFTATTEGSETCAALDVAGHEYTHAVANYIVGGIMYKNETGVINEGICDLMGELVELKDSEKNEFEIPAEELFVMGLPYGEQIRDLLVPMVSEQPASVGDVYYVPSVSIPDEINDFGGVHIDSGVISSIGAELFFFEDSTITALQQMWVTALCLMVPGSGYKEFAQILPMACSMTGNGDLKDEVERIIEEKGLLYEDPFDYVSEDYTLVKCTLPPWIDWTRARLVMKDESDYAYVSWPSKGTNSIYINVPPGKYKIQLTEFDRNANASGSWEYTPDGWNGKDATGEYVTISEDTAFYELYDMELK